MQYNVIAISLPHRINVLTTSDEDGEPIKCAALTDAAYMRVIGGMKQHYRMNREGRVRRFHHVRYDPKRPGPGADELGRDVLRVDALFAAALVGERFDERMLHRLFLYRDDADAAWSDLVAWARADAIDPARYGGVVRFG